MRGLGAITLDMTAITLVITVGAVVILAIIVAMLWNKNAAKADGPPRRHYTSLRILSLLMPLVGWVLIAATFAMVWVATQGPIPALNDTTGATIYGMTFPMGFIVGVSFIVTGIILVASGELILLFIDMERNTRGTEHYAAATQRVLASLLEDVNKPRDEAPRRRSPGPPPLPARQTARPPLGASH